MANHVTGTSAPHSVLPISLDELRQHVLTPLLGNPLFTAAEQLRANHFVHECEDAARLTSWHANVLAEIGRHTSAAARRRGRFTLYATLHRLNNLGFRGHRPRRSRPAPAWVPSTPYPDRADRQAGTFDRRAAACFRPVATLTLAYLLLARPRS